MAQEQCIAEVIPLFTTASIPLWTPPLAMPSGVSRIAAQKQQDQSHFLCAFGSSGVQAWGLERFRGRFKARRWRRYLAKFTTNIEALKNNMKLK